MARFTGENAGTSETGQSMSVEVVRFSHLKNFILSGENNIIIDVLGKSDLYGCVESA